MDPLADERGASGGHGVNGQSLTGLCAVCVMSVAEVGKMDVKEPLGSADGPGWRTVTGTEMHRLMAAWGQYGGLHADDVRITHFMLDNGEEKLPMLPVTTVDGMPVCASHVANLLNSKRRR